MPARLTRVEVDVYAPGAARDATQGVPRESPGTLVRTGHVLHSLLPLRGRSRRMFAREEREADWEAWTWSDPPILDNYSLVYSENATPVLSLDVVKVTPEGRRLHLLLKERGIEQPTGVS